MRQTLIVGVILFAAVALRANMLHAGLNYLPANADEILTFLQAKEIAQRGVFPLFFWTQPYQFPFEAYFVSYVFEYLPWNPFGVRIVQISLCLLAVPGFYLVLRELGTWRTTWPGILLVLFPSAYWLTRQVAHMTPQHAMSVTFAWLIPLAAAVSKRTKRPLLFCGAGGLACGFALSNHLLMVSLTVMAAAYICLGHTFSNSLKRTVSFLSGFLFGLAPYLYAKLFVPGAYQTVTETKPLFQSVSRIWNPVLTTLIPTGLGIDPHYIPDAIQKNDRFSYLVGPSTYLFAAMLVSLTMVASWRFIRTFRQNKWPSVQLHDVFLGTTWIAMLLLAMTEMGVRIRYTLPIVWSFPFLVVYFYSIVPRAGRILIGSIAVLLVGINCVNAIDITKKYKEYRFAAQEIFLDDLSPLYAYLANHNVTRCYAGWWLAYRIIFETKEQLICSPSFNDRFPGWPQPFYRKIVDRSENTPYVTGYYQNPLLRPTSMEPYLLMHDFLATREKVGGYSVYRNFRHADVPTAELVSREKLKVSASTNPAQAPLLIDGNLSTVWSSGKAQDASMSIDIELTEKTTVHALRLFSLEKNYQQGSPRVQIVARQPDGSWKELVDSRIGHPYLIKTATNRQPYHFDGLELMFGFSPISTTALRVQIVEPSPDRAWQLAEVQLLTGEVVKRPAPIDKENPPRI